MKERIFKQRDLALMVWCPIIITHKSKGKLKWKWEGPFVIETVFLNGAYYLTKPNWEIVMMPSNDKFIKKYYFAIIKLGKY